MKSKSKQNQKWSKVIWLTFLFLMLVVVSSSMAGLEESMVKGTNLRETISQLQGFGNRTTWEKQRQAANWALKKLRSLGLDTREHFYEFAGKTWVNVVGLKKGAHPEVAGVLLMAHLDSITRTADKTKAPGADDNGSGVAVLMETARILSGETLMRPVYFCFFSNEEMGSAGAKAFAREFKSRSGRLVAALNLDVLGYNLTDGPIPWPAIRAQDTLKYKTKALWRGLRNTYQRWGAQKDTIKVVGREPNRNLVLTVAGALEKHGGLTARYLVGKDCG
jgi:hypothetical protein